MVLGQRLKECRKMKKKTQQELSEILGINRSTYAKYETGDNEPDNQTLQLLADYFDVTTDWLLGRPTEYLIKRSKESSLFYDVVPVEQNISHPEMTRDELLNELTDDPDDLYFLDGYLDASEEEKKELRRHWLEIKRQMRENKIKPSSPMSLRDFNDKIKKSDT